MTSHSHKYENFRLHDHTQERLSLIRETMVNHGFKKI